MSGNPPSAVADFFAAFEVASQSMEATLPLPGSEQAAAPVVVTKAPAAKKPSTTNKKRKNGLGTTGVDLGGLNADLPSAFGK
ncbi:hypothetical protein FXN63_17830 [Pigmentiphaga aceris]|uniref:Uncharacterized protein n=1 Tax=Pigmentiphaga aceris TaxID=1940612 RepID=A0A5C0B3W7_9BURK|nr:hypothetical protein [Pigmentiphaga aceris]QEI07491.1 hypothetical protein FXN63_17830 [Pigmentiphaga aceris]